MSCAIAANTRRNLFLFLFFVFLAAGVWRAAGAERACGELLGMQSPCPETGGAKHIADVHAADVAGVGLFSKARRTAGCGRTDDSPAPRSVPLPSERGSGSAHRAEERNALLTCVACWRKLNRWEFSGA
jgi:hypothetical protein